MGIWQMTGSLWTLAAVCILIGAVSGLLAFPVKKVGLARSIDPASRCQSGRLRAMHNTLLLLMETIYLIACAVAVLLVIVPRIPQAARDASYGGVMGLILGAFTFRIMVNLVEISRVVLSCAFLQIWKSVGNVTSVEK